MCPLPVGLLLVHQLGDVGGHTRWLPLPPIAVVSGLRYPVFCKACAGLWPSCQLGCTSESNHGVFPLPVFVLLTVFAMFAVALMPR
jgi:hypothetical protein